MNKAVTRKDCFDTKFLLETFLHSRYRWKVQQIEAEQKDTVPVPITSVY